MGLGLEMSYYMQWKLTETLKLGLVRFNPLVWMHGGCGHKINFKIVIFSKN